MPLKCSIKPNTEEKILYICGYKTITEQDIDSFSIFFYEHLNKKEPFKVLYDLRDASLGSLESIKTLLVHIAKFEQASKNIVIASSILVSGATETLLNMVFNIRSPRTPTKVTFDVNVACDFLNSY
jgi:hypothetical protein